MRWNIESKFIIDTFTEFATKPEDGQLVTPEDSFEARLMPRCAVLHMIHDPWKSRGRRRRLWIAVGILISYAMG